MLTCTLSADSQTGSFLVLLSVAEYCIAIRTQVQFYGGMRASDLPRLWEVLGLCVLWFFWCGLPVVFDGNGAWCTAASGSKAHVFELFANIGHHVWIATNHEATLFWGETESGVLF